ncbi:MAG TPA: hypothetical protein PLE74_07470 [Candidatus Cloacimonadota bacterium]|nr:hypothetical protein [Candidatus Cloacimonadota bacterium]
MKRIAIILSLLYCISLFAEPLSVYIPSKQLPSLTQSTNFQEYITTNQPTAVGALIVGDDQTAVGITENEFSLLNLNYDKKVWNATSDVLPLPVNIHHISCIYLYVSNECTTNPKFQELRDKSEFLGQAEKNGYIIWKYKLPKGIKK